MFTEQQLNNDPNLALEPQVFSKQSQQFWFLQICGWTGYALVVFLVIVRPQFSAPDFNLSGQLINLAVETFSGFGLSYLQWVFIRKTVHLPLRHTLLLSFTSAAILGMVFNVIKLASYKTLVYNQPWHAQWDMLEFGGWLLFSVTTMFVWTAIFFIMLYNTKLQKEHELLLRAQTSAKEAQLQMLRYQLNPHFMFNTMNAISTLIYKQDNDKAGEMLDKLCLFFRYSLDQNTAQQSRLKKELELLELYLSIEKVRFGDKLNIALDVAPDVYSAKVPTLFLQPIVENAIKYGIESRKGDGTIAISAHKVNGKLNICVKDDGIGQTDPNSSGFGIGLNNTKERLNTLYNNQSSLNISHQSNGTTVKISIPYIS